jgi:mono/diheme cytochrome c family protein
MVPPPGRGGPGDPGNCGGGYANQKFNPVATKVPVTETTGEVDTNQFPEAVQLVSGVLTENGIFEAISSYPSAIAVSSDSKTVFATLEGSAALLAFSADLPGGFMGAPEAGVSRSPNGDVAFPPGGFSFRALVPVKTGAAPRGVAVIGDKVFVHSFFDRQVEEVELEEIQDLLEYQSTGIFEKALDLVDSNGAIKTLSTKNARIVTTNTVDADVDAGRRLFFAANNPMMATVGGGVSCATCHFDGRTDGITWTFARGPRQTPNLNVKLENTLPVGWAGNVATVADEGFNTSQKLMGGTGLTMGHTRQIEKFLFNMREIDSPYKNVNDEKVVRGAAVFSNVGCVSCHNGASFTDGKVYSMLSLTAVNTPALKGIAASAPYFHDGSASDLADVIDRASKGEMGTAFTISADEKSDLVAYLKSL